MPNTNLGVRVSPKDRELLERICKTRGEDLSDFIRRAIKKELASLTFCNQETRKALGIRLEAK
ncbi:ribbon-helix-helix protein, CopG family [Candidatus Bathyarchaeota archaeon]|nr:ribbon-helix-helix protein, CopG family [Candidatus Bathyarchaeota archaeon]